MSLDNLKILAIIPARSASKGIHRKNMKLVGGKSLIARAAIVANQVSFIDKVIISTDDKKMGEEGVKYGAEFPFYRPKKYSTDKSSSMDMWRNTWIKAERFYKQKYEISILLEPTSPLRNVKDIIKTVNLLVRGKANIVMTVSKTPSQYTAEKSFIAEKNGDLISLINSNIDYSLRQNIKTYYHKNGICYAVRRKYFIHEKRFIKKEKVKPLLIERQVVNIDDLEDLHLANWLIDKKTND